MPRPLLILRSAALVSTALALAAVAAMTAPLCAAEGDGGQTLEITGRVADPSGRPLAGMAVQLKASHDTVSLRRMSRVEAHPAYVTVVTDQQGDYRLAWQRHGFYDRFSLAVGLKAAGEEGGFIEVRRQDISRRLSEPGPVVVSLEVETTPLIERYLAFVATIDSEDQRRVFEQMGQPEKTDRLQVARHEEVTWWYFRRGKAYRFEGGRLDLVIPFEPVGN
jgi:hypothetical protein